MKNRFRSQIRNAETNPPKFVSFEDYVKAKRQSRNSSATKKVTPQREAAKPLSTTAGVVPETKKVTDLDLKEIEAKRKEALSSISTKEAKEIGKWGEAKQMEKTVRETHRRERAPRRERERVDTRNLKTMEDAGLTSTQPLTLNSLQKVEKPASSVTSSRQAKVIDVSADVLKKGESVIRM